MKATLAAAVLLVAAASAPAAVDSYMTFVTLPQPGVKLGDGSVLPAGRYDVKIVYKGFGNAAEFLFLQGGVLKGTAPAEARGFPSQAPAGAADASTVKLQKTSPEMKEVFQADPKTVKIVDPAVKLDTSTRAGSFSWKGHGFDPGAQGKAAPAGRGFLKLSFDSANSAAGFSALLPAVQKGAK